MKPKKEFMYYNKCSINTVQIVCLRKYTYSGKNSKKAFAMIILMKVFLRKTEYIEKASKSGKNVGNL